MADNEIRFDDGAAYEGYMGKWSRLAGEIFLEWLAPKPEMRWLDVGCGNGAFTEMLIERCAPSSVDGIDPSEEQLAYARSRFASPVAPSRPVTPSQPAAASAPATQSRLAAQYHPVAQFRPAAHFHRGDAMALPFGENTFDAAVMPLVIFFVPDPAVGVAEMARVVGPGGSISAYAWDMLGGGFPYDALWVEMRGLGTAVPLPPSPQASQIDALRDLWTGAGLTDVETRQITVQRTFADFDDYWTTILGGPSVGRGLATMSADDLTLLKSRMRARLTADATGQITCTARANAIKGRVRN